MDNPEKLATQGTPGAHYLSLDKEKQSKNTTQK